MRRLHPAAALLAAALLGSVSAGCAPMSVALLASPEVPAAGGTVKVLHKNENVRLRIQVHHLAQPGRLPVTAAVYVVWVRPMQPGAVPQNVGVLTLDKNLSGVLDTITPLHAFELLITPEPEGSVLAPTRAPVLTARLVMG